MQYVYDKKNNELYIKDTNIIIVKTARVKLEKIENFQGFVFHFMPYNTVDTKVVER
jgi:hypothetical protein